MYYLLEETMGSGDDKMSELFILKSKASSTEDVVEKWKSFHDIKKEDDSSYYTSGGSIISLSNVSVILKEDFLTFKPYCTELHYD